MKLLKKIRTSNFYQITAGSLLGQIIVILASPVTTRLYSPEQLGEYTLLITVVSLVLPVLNLKFDTLIVSEKPEERLLPISLSFYIGLLVSFVTTIVSIFFFKDKISIMLIILVLIILVLSSVNNIAIAISNSNSNYSLIGRFNFIKSLIQNGLLLIFGFINLDVFGMLLSQLLGSFSGTIKMFRDGGIGAQQLCNLKPNSLWRYFRKNLSFVLYSAPAHFVNSLSYNILNFFVTNLFGIGIFGYYSLAFRMLGMPLTVISQNFSKVFFKDASDEFLLYGKFSRSLKRHTLILIIFACPFFLVTFFLGPWLFSFIFGEKWIVAGHYVQLLSPMFTIRLVVSSLTPAFIISRKQNFELLFQIEFLVISVIIYLFFNSSHNLSIELFLSVVSCSYSVVYLLGYLQIINLSRGKND